jgi:hypothetical protein
MNDTPTKQIPQRNSYKNPALGTDNSLSIQAGNFNGNHMQNQEGYDENGIVEDEFLI